MILSQLQLTVLEELGSGMVEYRANPQPPAGCSSLIRNADLIATVVLAQCWVRSIFHNVRFYIQNILEW